MSGIYGLGPVYRSPGRRPRLPLARVICEASGTSAERRRRTAAIPVVTAHVPAPLTSRIRRCRSWPRRPALMCVGLALESRARSFRRGIRLTHEGSGLTCGGAGLTCDVGFTCVGVGLNCEDVRHVCAGDGLKCAACGLPARCRARMRGVRLACAVLGLDAGRAAYLRGVRLGCGDSGPYARYPGRIGGSHSWPHACTPGVPGSHGRRSMPVRGMIDRAECGYGFERSAAAAGWPGSQMAKYRRKSEPTVTDVAQGARKCPIRGYGPSPDRWKLIDVPISGKCLYSKVSSS